MLGRKTCSHRQRSKRTSTRHNVAIRLTSVVKPVDRGVSRRLFIDRIVSTLWNKTVES